MVHGAIALFIQAVFGIALRNWWAGAAVATSFFVAREITQAEYRWIEAFGGGRRANMPWWGGLDPAAWTPKSVMDVVVPLAVTLIVAALMQVLAKK